MKPEDYGIGKREIEFRAWDNDSNQMGQDFDGITTSGDIISTAVCCSTGQTIYENRRMTLMQYTGLKDKNGKKVFEGDIVKCGGLVELIRYIGPTLVCYSPKIYGDISREESDILDHVVVSGDFIISAVIGNIFENPELLAQ